jgi:hypothetical protein
VRRDRRARRRAQLDADRIAAGLGEARAQSSVSAITLVEPSAEISSAIAWSGRIGDTRVTQRRLAQSAMVVARQFGRCRRTSVAGTAGSTPASVSSRKRLMRPT